MSAHRLPAGVRLSLVLGLALAVGVASVIGITLLLVGRSADAAKPASGTGPWHKWAGRFGEPGPGGDAGRSTLVLYDDGGAQPWLGESNGVQAAQLASRGSRVVLRPVSHYRPGESVGYTGVLYASSGADFPLPDAFLDDVAAGNVPTLWLGSGIEQVMARAPGAPAVAGWSTRSVEAVPVAVEYRGQRLYRDPANGPTLGQVEVTPGASVQVLAQALWADGHRSPWALRAGKLTYIAESPFDYVGLGDRYLAAADLIRELALPDVPDRRRALVRLEDVGPKADPDQLRTITDFLRSENVPFSVAVYPYYVDPTGQDDDGKPTRLRLADRPEVVDALRYMAARGGTLVLHGYSHQFADRPNPYSGTSGSDYEFYTAHVDAQNYVQMDGPVPGDSAQWAADRMQRGRTELTKVGLPDPGAFEFPHYAGSAEDYRAANAVFGVRYDQGTYFGGWCPDGACGAGTAHPAELYQQYFPYPVRDVYGSVVVPENIGNIAPEAYNNNAPRLPADLIDAARAMTVVRDGLASFFYHPFLGVDRLRETVRGIEALGYRFVSPLDVLSDPVRGAPVADGTDGRAGPNPDILALGPSGGAAVPAVGLGAASDPPGPRAIPAPPGLCLPPAPRVAANPSRMYVTYAGRGSVDPGAGTAPTGDRSPAQRPTLEHKHRRAEAHPPDKDDGSPPGQPPGPRGGDGATAPPGPQPAPQPGPNPNPKPAPAPQSGPNPSPKPQPKSQSDARPNRKGAGNSNVKATRSAPDRVQPKAGDGSHGQSSGHR
ncbi:MAG: DUF2334 domain-containing protein [Pseudonocardiaceae bacterium]